MMKQQNIQELPDFCVNFLADGIVCAIVRWLSEKEPMKPEQFVKGLVILTKGVSFHAYDLIKQKQAEGMDFC